MSQLKFIISLTLSLMLSQTVLANTSHNCTPQERSLQLQELRIKQKEISQALFQELYILTFRDVSRTPAEGAALSYVEAIKQQMKDPNSEMVCVEGIMPRDQAIVFIKGHFEDMHNAGFPPFADENMATSVACTDVTTKQGLVLALDYENNIIGMAD